MKRFIKMTPLLLAMAFAHCTNTTKPPAAGADSFKLPSKDSPEAEWWRESMKTHDERMQWWREARFGMFVHWGVYSALGNEYQGQKGGGYAEHIQRVLKIPIEEYHANVAGSFTPTEFNADEWIRMAKEAGMGYFIITAKHHDGFAMWPSEVSDKNIAEATPFERDPMQELHDACKKYGLKFGFYYSHAFDWGEEFGPGNDWEFPNPGGDKTRGLRDWWNAERFEWFIPKARKYVDEKSIPQIRELIERYDPDIMWFDTPHKLPPSENFRIMQAVREASPDVVINGRLVREWGDYTSTADRPAEFSPHEGDWEGIPTTNESYGWNRFDYSHKTPEHFIRILAKAVARGGNILMNVGPMGNGRIDPKDAVILESIADWWKVYGESIRGSDRTPLQVQAWGESTRKGNTLYLHVFNWPENGQLVVGGLKSKVLKAYLLSDPNRSALEVNRIDALDVIIDVPKFAPHAANSVLVLQCEGIIEASPIRLLQPALASDTLHVFDAQLKGDGMDFGAGKTRDAYVTGFSNADKCIVWPARLNEPASFEVEITYDADADGRTFTVMLGSEILKGTVKSGNLQTISLGQIFLEPGDVTISLAPDERIENEVMRPRSLILTPLK